MQQLSADNRQGRFDDNIPNACTESMTTESSMKDDNINNACTECRARESRMRDLEIEIFALNLYFVFHKD